MLSLFSFDPMHAPSNQPPAPKPAPRLVSADQLLSRVLDCSEHYRFRQNCDGSETPFRILRKPLPGVPAGTVLPLADLHEKLAGLSIR